ARIPEIGRVAHAFQLHGADFGGEAPPRAPRGSDASADSAQEPEPAALVDSPAVARAVPDQRAVFDLGPAVGRGVVEVGRLHLRPADHDLPRLARRALDPRPAFGSETDLFRARSRDLHANLGDGYPDTDSFAARFRRRPAQVARRDERDGLRFRAAVDDVR